MTRLRRRRPARPLRPRRTADASTSIDRRQSIMATQPTTGIATALHRNHVFADAGGHEGAVVFPDLRLFVITCLDPRVDPAHFLGLDLSDAMVIRNVGGRVTPEVTGDVAFISQLAEGALPTGRCSRLR